VTRPSFGKAQPLYDGCFEASAPGQGAGADDSAGGGGERPFLGVRLAVDEFSAAGPEAAFAQLMPMTAMQRLRSSRLGRRARTIGQELPLPTVETGRSTFEFSGRRRQSAGMKG
jgi:hypothetical protein